MNGQLEVRLGRITKFQWRRPLLCRSNLSHAIVIIVTSHIMVLTLLTRFCSANKEIIKIVGISRSGAI